MTPPQSGPDPHWHCPHWHCAAANSEGFIELRKLKERALALTPEAFAAEFPAPALRLFTSDSHPLLAETDEGDDHGVQLLTISIKSAAILRYLGKVAFIAKRPGNFLAHLISIGRSSRNDVVIGVESVSKVHGYFAWEHGRWSFTDHSSTTGSRRNDQALAPGTKYTLEDRDVLQLGLEVQLEFLTPESLYLRARRG